MTRKHAFLLAIVIVLCAGCAPTPEPWPVWEDERIIPFQTIDVDNDSRPLLPESAGEPELTEKYDLRTAWPESVPTVSQLYKIESVDDVEPLVGLLPTATIDYLRSVDYDANVVFALLRGQRGGGGFAVFIEQVAVGMGGMRVYAQFRVRTSGTDGYTFPYHIVKVKLSDLAWSAPWMPVDFLARLCDDEQQLDPAAQHALDYVAEQRKLSPDQLTIRYREDVTFPILQRSFVRFVIAAPADASSANGCRPLSTSL